MKIAKGLVCALPLAVLGGCQGQAVRSAPAEVSTVAPAAVSAPAQAAAAPAANQHGWLENTGDAAWSVITLPVRALTPRKPPAPPVIERDPPARLVVVSAHPDTEPATMPSDHESAAPARLGSRDSAQ